MSTSYVILLTPAPITNATSEENLGLGYIAASLRSKGVEVLIMDGWMENLTPDEIAERMFDMEKPLFVAFSCYQLNKDIALETVDYLKSKGYDVPFIAGGFGPTFHPEEFLNGGFDVVSLCEGEYTSFDLYNYFKWGTPSLDQIKGICYKDENGNICRNNPELIEDLDVLEFPSRDTMHIAINGNTPVDIIGSRGCMGSCMFCSVMAFWRKAEGTKYRHRSVNSIVDEIEILNKQGAWFFKFVDDSFIEPPRDEEWCRAFAEEINRRGLKIRFRVSMRADRVTDGIIHELCKCGLISLQLGIENFTSTALKRMGKKADLEQNIKALEIVKKYREKYGLCLQMGFILFDYGTTLDEVKQNYMMLEKYSWAITRGFTEMYAAVDTPYTNLLMKKGIATLKGYGNYSYPIIDEKVQRLYHALKAWHINYMKLYDKTIDPVTKPKALSNEGFVKFHTFYMKIKETELAYFRKALQMVEDNEEQSVIDDFVNKSIEESKDWIAGMHAKVEELYKSEKIFYNAYNNPFMAK